MTTRRSLLRLAGGAAGVVVLGACTSRTGAQPEAPTKATPADLLFVATAAGLTVVRADTGKPTLDQPAVLATADWARVVAAQPEGASTRIVTREAKTGQIMSGGTFRDRLEPRVISPDGRLVALATPGAREQTTIVVVDAGGERVRFNLRGNIEPEAFSAAGDMLFVLDHLPPLAPDRYRVRMVDLRTGHAQPLFTKDKVPVPAGAEEEMRGQGRPAAYDATRKMLFTLYTHQPDHEHTRDLLGTGARKGKPHVHAFVHSLHLEQGWAFCVDLPAPFGEGPAAAHAITKSPTAGLLTVVDASSGSVASIDADELTVTRVTKVAAQQGEAWARETTGGDLVVAAGTSVRSMLTGRSIRLPAPARGLALGTGTTIWVGQENAAVTYDTASGAELARVSVPGLVGLRHVIPVA